MSSRKTLPGLLGALGIWVTAGVALPMVNVLDSLEPTQLMVVRGFATAAIALAIMRGALGKANVYTYLIGITLPFATLGLFEGVRGWGAGPTIVVITLAPMVNMLFALHAGRRPSKALVVGFALLITGVSVTCKLGAFHWVGLSWSLLGAVMCGFAYECIVRSNGNALSKCFWGSVGMGLLGVALSLGHSWSPLMEPNTAILLASFAFVGGFLYWVANLVAFANLPTTEASVLAQGETPAVIIGAYIITGERLTTGQWAGVAIALFGAGYLSYSMAKQKT